uniref:HTH merR-type domain-containing protein n=1 Tax=viral metagenome TaxID=1070528 RepID=A0A6C0ECZ5_9ZZZZ
MKSKDVLRILGISRVTLWSYVKFGKIKVTKLSNGFYDYDDKSVYDCAGKKIKLTLFMQEFLPINKKMI